MGCPRGMSTIRCTRLVLEISQIFFGKRRSLLHPNTAQRVFIFYLFIFSLYNLIVQKDILYENFKKNAPKGAR